MTAALAHEPEEVDAGAFAEIVVEEVDVVVVAFEGFDCASVGVDPIDGLGGRGGLDEMAIDDNEVVFVVIDHQDSYDMRVHRHLARAMISEIRAGGVILR